MTRLLLEGRCDELPFSAFPPDGTWPNGTSQFEKRGRHGIALGRRKLQERAGRWLKLLGGVVILVLGALLVFAPQALVW